MDQAELLTEAFHSLYDTKDAAAKNGDESIRLSMYVAIRELSDAMETLGVEVPRRFDGTGRNPQPEVLVEWQPDGNVVVKHMPIEWCTQHNDGALSATICLDPAIAATLMESLAKAVQS